MRSEIKRAEKSPKGEHILIDKVPLESHLVNQYPSICSSHYTTLESNEPPKRLHNRLLVNLSTDFDNEKTERSQKLKVMEMDENNQNIQN